MSKLECTLSCCLVKFLGFLCRFLLFNWFTLLESLENYLQVSVKKKILWIKSFAKIHWALNLPCFLGLGFLCLLYWYVKLPIFFTKCWHVWFACWYVCCVCFDQYERPGESESRTVITMVCVVLLGDREVWSQVLNC